MLLDFSQTLYSSENDFLNALDGGAKTLALWCQMWSALSDDLYPVIGTTYDQTPLVHFIASRISNIASCYLDVKHEEESFASELRKDCDVILHRINALDLNSDPESMHADGTTQNAESPFLLFHVLAYRWLLDNLHNPYPSAEVKARIAAVSSCQVSSINSWFINTRRRIGWTTLCREHFANCRADMLDAAYCALVEEDPQRPLSPGLRHSFVTMKVAVEGLCSSNFTRSVFAGDLDVLVKDPTKENEKPGGPGECSQSNRANVTKMGRNSSHSSDPPILAFPVPGLVDSLTNESEEDVAPPTIAGTKRRLSSMEPVDQPSCTTSRPIKRLRGSTTSRTSPSASTDGPPELPPAYSTPPGQNQVSPSRKRRLSDADVTGIPKNQNDSITVPCLQAVSDPLSRSNMESEYSIDDWFKTNFDDLFTIPPPVDASEPDFSASWEAELFTDYSVPGDAKYAPECSSAPTANTHLPAPTDISDLDSLLKSIGSDAFVTPSDISNVAGTPYTTYLDLLIPDISHISVDRTPLINDTATYQPIVSSTIFPHSQPSPPEIDLATLQLPQVMPSVNPQVDSASKQGKLHQLHAMREAVWRMEQELRSEGIVL